jgi:small subunit ribosomal protein S20
LTPSASLSISAHQAAGAGSPPLLFRAVATPRGAARAAHDGTLMANTKSAKKATRKIARRTEINKTRRSRMRSYVRAAEEAIAGGDKQKALAALQAAQPELMRAAQRGVIHKKTASRKVSRLTHQIGKLGQ